MRAVLHFHTDMTHQRVAAEAMRSGLEKHGVTCAYGHYNSPTCRDPDFVVIWGAPVKQPAVTASAPHVLVMERGHLQDRNIYTSCGWDGLARRGRYPTAPNGERWERLFGHMLKPWRAAPGYALLIGQVSGDAAVRDLDMDAWIKEQTVALEALGWEVKFRPHPFTRPVRQSLAQQLAGAGLCVTYNSTTGVEAVLAGVPTITMDEGAMAWDVSGHTLTDILCHDREQWAHNLAWTSWTLDEIAAGLPYEHLAPIMEETCTVA